MPALAPLPLVPAVGFVNLGHHLACPEGGSIVPETSLEKKEGGKRGEKIETHQGAKEQGTQDRRNETG